MKLTELKAKPGAYIFDTKGLAVGRINNDLTEDNRFTAFGKCSIANGIISASGYTPKNPESFHKAVQSKPNGYILMGYTVCLELSELPVEMWCVKAAEILGGEYDDLKELLTDLSKQPEVERQAKLASLSRMFAKEKKAIQKKPKLTKAQIEWLEWVKESISEKHLRLTNLIDIVTWLDYKNLHDEFDWRLFNMIEVCHVFTRRLKYTDIFLDTCYQLTLEYVRKNHAEYNKFLDNYDYFCKVAYRFKRRQAWKKNLLDAITNSQYKGYKCSKKGITHGFFMALCAMHDKWLSKQLPKHMLHKGLKLIQGDSTTNQYSWNKYNSSFDFNRHKPSIANNYIEVED